MKNVTKMIFINVTIFILTIILLDLGLSFIFDKDIKDFQKYRVEPIKKSTIGIISTKEKMEELGVKSIKGYPYWEVNYRGPTIYYQKNKNKVCRVLGIGGSIMYGSGVKEKESYFHQLSNKINNSEFINLAIPGSMPLQQIIRLEKKNLLHDTNLLIWSIWHDDFIYFTYSNGVLYNSKVILTDYGDVSFSDNIPKNINNFLINNSLFYNKLLKIKLSNEVNIDSKNVTEDYILNKIKKQADAFLELNTNNQVLFLMSPYLGTKLKKVEDENHIYMIDKFEKFLGDIEKISIVDLEKLLNVEDLSPYNLDDVHFNVKGSEIVGEKLFNYIKNNKLLDEKCY